MDPSKVESTEQQPGTSGQMSPRPKKYVSLESIALQLLSIEYDFLRELSHLIKSPEHTYGLVCMTNLPDETSLHQEGTYPFWVISERNPE